MCGLLSGCGGPSDETQLLELRVLSMIPAAPEISPMETTDLDVRVVDPTDTGARVLVWTCTLLGESCLEDDEGRTAVVATPDAGHVHTDVTASAALAYVASETPLPIVFVWALACTDGACPVFGEVDAGTTVDPAFWLNPIDAMAGLPIQGTSLAFTSLSVSTRSAETRHINPTLTVDPGLASAAPEAELSVLATAAGELGPEAKFWSYAEGGGFTSTDERPSDDGSVEFTWVAPETTGESAAFVLFVDDLGGSALWEGQLTSVSGG